MILSFAGNKAVYRQEWPGRNQPLSAPEQLREAHRAYSMTSMGFADLAGLRERLNRGRPKTAAVRHHAADSTKVSCGTSTLPLVSGLNSRVTTNTTAAPTVPISIGMVKPSGWPIAK